MREPKVSFILTRNLVAKAVEMVMPAIKNAMEKGILKRKDLSICVVDPKNESILYAVDLGNKKEWKYPFDKLAISKAKVAKRAKKDTSRVRQRQPWMFEKGDTVYSGGVYFQGIVVGVSGVEQEFDEMIAKWIVYTIKALCLLEYKATVKLMEEQGGFFLSELQEIS